MSVRRADIDPTTGELAVEPPTGPGVAEQLAGALAGDAQQWRALVERFTPMLHAVVAAYRLGDEADDVVQGTFLILFERAAQIRDPRALPGWLKVTARNEALRVLRRRQRVVLPATDDWESREVCEAECPADRVVRLESHAALHDLMAELPAKQRALLGLLAESDRPDYRRVGEIVGMPVSSIGPTRRRGLDKLRRAWDARYEQAA